MLSIFTASTRFSADTGSPVNGDRKSAPAALRACPPPCNASSAPATRAARTTTAATVTTVLYRAHLIASSRVARGRTARAVHIRASPYHRAADQTPSRHQEIGYLRQ